jgi:hypothetical protein
MPNRGPTIKRNRMGYQFADSRQGAMDPGDMAVTAQQRANFHASFPSAVSEPPET